MCTYYRIAGNFCLNISPPALMGKILSCEVFVPCYAYMESIAVVTFTTWALICSLKIILFLQYKGTSWAGRKFLVVQYYVYM